MSFLKYLSSAKVQSIWMEELGAIPINKKHTPWLTKKIQWIQHCSSLWSKLSIKESTKDTRL